MTPPQFMPSAELSNPNHITVVELPTVALDPDGRITVDIACRKCGYNLRSLSAQGQCPECGADVALSLQSNLLRFSDPTWVNTLHAGMSWIIRATALHLALIFMIVLSAALWRQRFWGMSAIYLGASLLMLIGVWQVSVPDPSGFGEHQGASLRKLARAFFVMRPTMDSIRWLIRSSYLASFWLVPSALIDIAGELALFLYSRRLALRIPNQKLARRCLLVMCGRILFQIVALSSWIMWTILGSTAGPGRIVAILSNIGEFLLLLVFSIWTILLFRRFRKETKIAIDFATSMWAKNSRRE